MKRKFTHFIDGRGFYIALAVCLLLIGGCTVYLIHSVQTDTLSGSGSTEVSGGVSVIAEESDEAQEVLSIPETDAAETAAEEEPEAEESPAGESTADEPAAETVTVSRPVISTWPVQGSVITAFSPDTLLLDATMGDWRTHSGIDLMAEEGSNVLAVADGTVTDISNDILLGTVLTLDHGGGLVSIYANLANETTVDVGDSVTAGCVLGQVGATAAGESALASHLHFAMTLDGEAVDPMAYLPISES
ncbi:MAG: M23 family metallopeptidase [Oscillospiraceae bacterium]|nr:M23 family metallopeptidase [Oscillospiraceae bacterium]